MDGRGGRVGRRVLLRAIVVGAAGVSLGGLSGPALAQTAEPPDPTPPEATLPDLLESSPATLTGATAAVEIAKMPKKLAGFSAGEFFVI